MLLYNIYVDNEKNDEEEGKIEKIHVKRMIDVRRDWK